MVLIYTLILSTISILLVNNHEPNYIYILTSLLTSVYYFQLFTDISVNFSLRLKNGELVHQILFITWMYLFPQEEYMFYAPLVLSNVGKLYAILHEKNDDNQVIIQELIKFQSKIELFLALTLLVKLIHPTTQRLIQFLCFSILCKCKYTFYFPCQKSYVQLHFMLDKIAKRWGIRRSYHFIHNLISKLGGVMNSSKEIGY